MVNETLFLHAILSIFAENSFQCRRKEKHRCINVAPYARHITCQGAKMIKLTILFVVLVRQCLLTLSSGVNYPVYDLGALCDQRITIPCPYVNGKGGTLQLLQRPEQRCGVEIRLADNCGHCGNENVLQYAFYFNIRNFTKYPTDTVEFLASKWQGPVYKTLNGSVTPANNPPSVAQYKTPFGITPMRYIEYQLDTTNPLNTDPTEVVIDFVVIERYESQENNEFCYDLDAYVHRDLICDTTDNRINCPERYSASTGFNPADGRQCSDPLPPLPSVFNGTYQIFDAEKRCDEVITLPCPTETSGRSGRLQFNYLPTSTCEVTVQLEENCTSAIFDSFAIYLNMKQVNVFTDDALLIYETLGGNRTLRQELRYRLNDTEEYSKAQFLTAYGEQPVVHLVYNRTSATCLQDYKIAVDYSVLHGTSLPSSSSTYCAALNGFVHNDLLCTKKTSRINCPDRYRPYLHGNGAGDVQCAAEERTSYHILNLEYLKPTVTIPCPTTIDGRVGSLYADSNATSFRVNFTLPSGCGGDNDTFALYFNIRSLLLSTGKSLTIYKQYPGEATMRLEKHFVGPVDQIIELSVAQYLSPFEQQPFVTLEFEGGFDNNDFFMIDYAVYSKTSNTGNAFCPALDGYIREDLLCDNDGTDNRINCPSSYNASLSLNPATARHCTKPRTTIQPTTTSRTTTVRSTTRTTTRFTPGSTPSTTGRTTARTTTGSTRSTTGRTTARTTTRTTRSTTRGTTTWNWWDITTRRPSYPTTTAGYWWLSTTDRWNWYTTQDPWNWATPAPYAPLLSGGSIAGIVIGVLAGVAILVAVLVLVCRRSAAPSKTQPPVSYTTNPNAQAPVVVGHAPQATAPYYAPNQPQPYPGGYPAPYPTGHQLPYPAGQPMQAPPSYSAVVQGAHPPHSDAHLQPRA